MRKRKGINTGARAALDRYSVTHEGRVYSRRTGREVFWPVHRIAAAEAAAKVWGMRHVYTACDAVPDTTANQARAALVRYFMAKDGRVYSRRTHTELRPHRMPDGQLYIALTLDGQRAIVHMPQFFAVAHPGARLPRWFTDPQASRPSRASRGISALAEG